MITANATLRALFVYAIITPLALVLGYLLATPQDFGSFAFVSLILTVLFLPILLKWHRQLLLLVWNMTAVLFFLPGRPHVWLAAAFVSLTISVLQRAVQRDMHFVQAPSVALSLLFLAVVVYLTGKLTGGFGLYSFGSSTIGGRRYVEIFGGIAGFFALIAQPVPPRKALLFVGLFFLGALTDAIGNTVNFMPPSLYYIFLLFPAEGVPGQESAGIFRFFSASLALMGVYWYLLARYGIKDMLGSARNLARLALLLAVVILTMASGFRSYFILMALTFFVLFYFEGLFRTRYAGMLVLLLVTGCVLVVPLADRLPLSIQRTLSVLPINVSPEARINAQNSTDWRVQMWREVLPDVPRYFWLGKGLTMDLQDFQLANMASRTGAADSTAAFEVAASYHNGPLTTIIPFGIWGFLGLIWFLAASIRALHLNYLHGEPELKKINTFLLAYFVARSIYFFTVFGNFYTDMPIFTGIIGLGLALNGGIRKPVRSEVQPATIRFGSARLRPVADLPGVR